MTQFKLKRGESFVFKDIEINFTGWMCCGVSGEMSVERKFQRFLENNATACIDFKTNLEGKNKKEGFFVQKGNFCSKFI